MCQSVNIVLQVVMVVLCRVSVNVVSPVVMVVVYPVSVNAVLPVVMVVLYPVSISERCVTGQQEGVVPRLCGRRREVLTTTETTFGLRLGP